ncbi:MAG TPA: alternative ribosome rescue aminoacyl-tRNA hydrolase ArfB [Steroidobacteraceae bacterium]|nr:alternative ribosome rescue aminoacyl-tRNA hydrolase ArfB [Steroidobacteraceae bacterium]
MPLPVAPGVEIPDRELRLSFVRARGPGGQNVNKVATAAQLRFDLERSAALTDAVKARLRALSGRRLTADGAILIVARNHRTQEHNRREALSRLAELIRRALVTPKLRKASVPSPSAHERRLEHKTRLKHRKRLRERPMWEE